MPAIPLLVGGLAVSVDEITELEEAAAVLSAVESGLGEHAASATKVMIIVDAFAAKGKLVMVLSVGGH